MVYQGSTGFKKGVQDGAHSEKIRPAVIWAIRALTGAQPSVGSVSQEYKQGCSLYLVPRKSWTSRSGHVPQTQHGQSHLVPMGASCCDMSSNGMNHLELGSLQYTA